MKIERKVSAPVNVRLVFNPGSFWMGWHWSGFNRRLCINLIPCVTITITKHGGVDPGTRKRWYV